MSDQKRTVEEQQFIDIAAIQIFAAAVSRTNVPVTFNEALAEMSFNRAEALLNERNKRK